MENFQNFLKNNFEKVQVCRTLAENEREKAKNTKNMEWNQGQKLSLGL